MAKARPESSDLMANRGGMGGIKGQRDRRTDKRTDGRTNIWKTTTVF